MSTSASDNKALVQRVMERLDARDLDGVVALYAPGPGSTASPPSRSTARATGG